MKKSMKKTDFYGIILFILFMIWTLITYGIFTRYGQIGRIMNAWGLIALIFGEIIIRSLFNDNQTIRFK